MLKMDIIHHLLVIFRYFYGRVKLFPVGGTNARQFWMVMHRFWPDGHPQLTIAIRDQPKLKAGKNKIPWWWRNYFCCAFLGLRTDALPTPVTLVYSRALKPFDFKAICVKSRFCSCRNSLYISLGWTLGLWLTFSFSFGFPRFPTYWLWHVFIRTFS